MNAENSAKMLCHELLPVYRNIRIPEAFCKRYLIQIAASSLCNRTTESDKFIEASKISKLKVPYNCMILNYSENHQPIIKKVPRTAPVLIKFYPSL